MTTSRICNLAGALVDPIGDAPSARLQAAGGALCALMSMMLPGSATAQAKPSAASPATCTYTWTQGCSGPMSGLLAIDFGDISWQVCLKIKGIKGVWIESAAVRRPGQTTYSQVLDATGPAEIFVPYNAGPFWAPTSPLRWYDMNNWALLPDRVDSVDLPTFGTASLETLSGDSVPRVVVECRDRGISLLDKSHTGAYAPLARRSLEVVAWSVYDAGNYDYIVEYGFRNDGTIALRMGATGFNAPDFPEVGHMHNVLWNVHFNLMGDGADGIEVETHADNASGASDYPLVVTNEFLGVGDKAIKYFPKLHVEDASVNFHGHHPGYNLQWAKLDGFARHSFTPTAPFFVNEAWTQWDCAVTQWRASEFGWQNAWTDPNFVAGFVNNEVPTNPLIWCRTATYHDPHDEDRADGDLPCGTTGLTNVHWTGLDLTPDNFFESNPVGGIASGEYFPLPTNCISWWKFNSSVAGSPPQTKDAKANVMGAMQGGCAIQAGSFGGSVGLNGTSQWVEPTGVGANYLDITNGDFTVDAWVNVGATSSIRTILDKRNVANGNVAGYTMYLYNGKLGFQVASANTWGNYVTTALVPTGRWVHVAVVVQRSGTPQLICYINGGSANGGTTQTFAPQPGFAGNLGNSGLARIGQHASGGYFFPGGLDDLCVYARALSAAEILGLATHGKSGGR